MTTQRPNTANSRKTPKPPSLGGPLPTIINVPPGAASTLTVETMRQLTDPVVKLIAPGGKLVWHLGGGKAPWPGVEEGMSLVSIAGMQAPAQFKDQQGSNQDGVTNNGKVFDPAEIDMMLSANAPLNPNTMLPDAAGMRRVMRWWTETWADNRQSKLTYTTPEMGEWWMPVRQFRPITETFKYSYAQTGEQELQWAARGDDSFWFSFDSEDELRLVTGTSVTGWLSLANRGTQKGWYRALCYGPGYFDLGDGTSGNTVTFGPLLDGQVVLITTLPRLRSVIDLTPTGAIPAQQLNLPQQLLVDLIDFATNNNTPPLLQMFESWAGVRPPQGQLYGLMQGRFANPLPGIEEGQPPTLARIPVQIRSGVAGKSRIVGALTPMRTWPE